MFVVLDEATYRAVAESELLGSLGAFEERTTARPDVTYTGLYAYGRHTYFEFLAPDEAGGLPPGSSGVATPIDPPATNAPFGPRLWGVARCIPSEATYAAFLADALCPLSHVGAQDLDQNLIPDVCDLFFDCNGNGVHDSFDPDCDGDGIPDDCELDCDGDGVPNGCDPDPGQCQYPCPPIGFGT